MRELIQNAWLGWQNYKEGGKLAALLIIGLLLFWFAEKKFRNRYLTLILYSTLMTVCCICPLTAAILMKYQTKFYDYQWIWGVVPMTIIIALSGTLLWTELMDKYSKQKGRKWKCIGITVAMLAVVFVSGSMGNTIRKSDEEFAKQEETAKILEIITKNGQNTDIKLWAPQGIMEYARVLDGNIRLPYGRNMMDEALNAYVYDVYGEAESVLYAWMSHAEETGEGEVAPEGVDENITGTDCLDIAQQLGVNYILLPGNLQTDVLTQLEDYLEVQAENVEGYYLFRIG